GGGAGARGARREAGRARPQARDHGGVPCDAVVAPPPLRAAGPGARSAGAHQRHRGSRDSEPRAAVRDGRPGPGARHGAVPAVVDPAHPPGALCVRGSRRRQAQAPPRDEPDRMEPRRRGHGGRCGPHDDGLGQPRQHPPGQHGDQRTLPGPTDAADPARQRRPDGHRRLVRGAADPVVDTVGLARGGGGGGAVHDRRESERRGFSGHGGRDRQQRERPTPTPTPTPYGALPPLAARGHAERCHAPFSSVVTTVPGPPLPSTANLRQRLVCLPDFEDPDRLRHHAAPSRWRRPAGLGPDGRQPHPDGPCPVENGRHGGCP
ncbi:hypothetical protein CAUPRSCDRAFT_12204, partial [Caulochytrium protostelioides]